MLPWEISGKHQDFNVVKKSNKNLLTFPSLAKKLIKHEYHHRCLSIINNFLFSQTMTEFLLTITIQNQAKR